ncbi:hypothetical protein BV25DRAFT_1843379 [Artomyces pyxidatus]|uniref:Uncharacterized protein n=1 Tax=Artomyces pyxidatus TaxID=48021 RepID=A0ACB8SEZ5_9AGAM|nr:hypothetical protein BV25DRAFT_1843379 [Artomyces pyxidatus]
MSTESTRNMDLREKYIWYSVHSEQSRAQIDPNGVPSDDAEALYNRTREEFESNPKYPNSKFPTEEKGKAEFWHKCESVCKAHATSADEHLLHWFTAALAMQFIDRELGDERGVLADAHKEVWRILHPNAEVKPYVPPADAFKGVHLLDWVGLSFTHPASNVRYLVEDAGTSALEGSYFELMTEDGQRTRVPSEQFEKMVEGISIPDEEDY